MTSIPVNTSKKYSVFVGNNILPQVGNSIKEACGGEIAALVTDDIVGGLYGETLDRSLAAAGYSTVKFVFPNGEKSKNMETYAALLCFLADSGLSRSDVIVALGGGVVGDLAGFAAATFMRGIPFVQIPTTVLSMVDSSVGGKTAVDLPAGKNLAGSFYQPNAVFCDVETLKTLPEDIFNDGCAEMIKHGIIQSAQLFDLLKEPIRHRMDDVIMKNITIKRDIVEVDEKETGLRRMLNLGHTIGHGIEKHSNYAISHGKSVAIGLVIASRGAYRLGVCDEICHLEIVDAVRRYNLPTETDISPEALLNAAWSDKKRSGQNIMLVLPERIGKCVVRNYGMYELEAFIKFGMMN